MSPEEEDGWHAGMLDIQGDLAKRAVAEVNRLRKRVRELEAQIAATPAETWALQERVTQLEILLGNAGVRGSDGGPA